MKQYKWSQNKSSDCLIEAGWSYKAAGGTEGDDFELEYTENTQDCAAFAYNVSKDHYSYSRATYWTYRLDTKECAVVFNKNAKSESEGRVSGSSDCSIPAPGMKFKDNFQFRIVLSWS